MKSIQTALVAVICIFSLNLFAAATCPEGFIKVPADSSNTTADFCVMKYEAKELMDKPASLAEKLPWVSISRDEAVTKCQSLGAGYDMISNNQWQTIAQNAEMQKENWTGGAVGNGCLFNGNSNDKICGYNGKDPEAGKERNPRGKLTLSNGEEIWDLAGNVWEWVKDDQVGGYETDLYMSKASDAAKAKFGSRGSNYSCDVKNGYCGFGLGWLQYAAGGILRGGFSLSEDATGVFTVYLGFEAGNSTSSMGFRCVYTAL